MEHLYRITHLDTEGPTYDQRMTLTCHLNPSALAKSLLYCRLHHKYSEKAASTNI